MGASIPLPLPTQGCPNEYVNLETDCTRYDDILADDSDGGFVWIDNVINEEGKRQLLATTHLFRGQDGDLVPPTIPVNSIEALTCHWVGGTDEQGATPNPDPEHIWPFGDAAALSGATASHTLGGRRYFRLGESVSLSDGSATIELPYRENTLSKLFGGLWHNRFYEVQRLAATAPEQAFGGSGDNFMGTYVTVGWPGGADVGKTTWRFEVVPSSGRAVSGLGIPARPYVSSINGRNLRFSAGREALGETNQPASVELDPTQDMVITYDYEDNSQFPSYGVLAFYQEEPRREVTHYCLFAHPLAARVPQAIFEQLAPAGLVTLSRMSVAHRTVNGDNRVDLVGLSTTSARYTLVAP